MEFKIYVGNLPYSTSEDEMKEFFGEAGTVVDARIIRDRETNRSKGFGFVTFETEDAMTSAIEKFNSADFGGRSIKVDRAKAPSR